MSYKVSRSMSSQQNTDLYARIGIIAIIVIMCTCTQSIIPFFSPDLLSNDDLLVAVAVVGNQLLKSKSAFTGLNRNQVLFYAS